MLLMSSSCIVFAQGTLSVRGVLLDPSGAAIAGAHLHLETPVGTVVSETISGTKGDFSLTGLPAGVLTLVVPGYSGFAPKTLQLTLTSNITGLKLSLAASSVNQEITVDAEQRLSTDASANRDTVAVSGGEMSKLPVFDQDYVAALIPFLDASSISSGGVTLIVDGVEMKSVGVSASAIQEVRINNDPYSTEFNRPGRGRIEITTKPGSPDFHGAFNFTFRDAIFNANNYFAPVRPPEVRRIYEGHFTGPLGHGGHTNFIASGSYRTRDSSVVVNAVEPSGPVIDSVLTPNRNSQAALRVTHDFSPTHRLQVGYNFELGSNKYAGVGGIVEREAGYDTTSREDDAIFNDRIIITPNLINQLLVTFEKDEDVTRSVTDAQSIQVNGSFVKGGAQADVSRTENTIHVNEVMSWSHKKQYVRFGVQLPQFSRRAVDDRTNHLGTYGYASLANYTGNTPYIFTQQLGPGGGTGRGIYWANEFGAFVQDQIQLTPKLQVSLGVRYDWQTYVSDDNNFAPRASLAYSMDKGKTILRLGSGVFYDRTGGDFPSTVKLHDGVQLHAIQLQNPQGPTPTGAAFYAIPTNIARFASNIRSPYTIQSSIGIERQLHKTITITGAYRNSVQVKSFRSRDANAPILPPNPILTADYPRPNPNFGQIQQIESGGRQLVNALDLSFRGKAGRWFSGQAQYTLSRVENNTGGITWFPQDQYNPNKEWGRANTDRLHALNLLGNINPDHWLTLGVSLTLYSGSPYTETTGDDNYHTGLGNARPAGVGRNTLQGGGTADLDLIWNHDFYLTKARGDKAKILSGGISAFNVLNHPNYTNYIGALTSSLYGQPTAALPGRQMQFSLGFQF
jgi:hypothetical protein